jgi:uridine kinase
MNGPSNRKPREISDGGISSRNSDRRRPVVVAIAGGSGSGKTWLADRLQAMLGRKVLRISLDSFYRDRSRVAEASRVRINFDHPRAIDWAAVEQALDTLLKGGRAQIPIYDFKTHSRLLRIQTALPRPIILLEGLWPLRRRHIRRLVSLGIFLRCPARVRLDRRVARDKASRGRTSTSVRRQFRACVEPMHRRFVEPQAKVADLVLRETCGATELTQLADEIRRLLDKSLTRHVPALVLKKH